jgi:hypothetical protein
MNGTRLLAIGMIASLAVTPAPSANPNSATSTRVELRKLVINEQAYFGKGIVVHGCLVNAFHGYFIHACGGEPGPIVLVDVPESKERFVADVFFDQLHANFGVEAEADVVGTIVKQNTNDILGNKTSNKKYMLQLENVLNAKIFRKP